MNFGVHKIAIWQKWPLSLPLTWKHVQVDCDVCLDDERLNSDLLENVEIIYFA